MTDLDALTALLAAATTYCEQHMEMEHVNQIPPCAGARHEAEWWAEAFRLPALIEAARREAALQGALKQLPRYKTRPFSNGGDVAPHPDGPWVAWFDLIQLLHDNAGATARGTDAE